MSYTHMRVCWIYQKINFLFALLLLFILNNKLETCVFYAVFIKVISNFPFSGTDVMLKLQSTRVMCKYKQRILYHYVLCLLTITIVSSYMQRIFYIHTANVKKYGELLFKHGGNLMQSYTIGWSWRNYNKGISNLSERKCNLFISTRK